MAMMECDDTEADDWMNVDPPLPFEQEEDADGEHDESPAVVHNDKLGGDADDLLPEGDKLLATHKARLVEETGPPLPASLAELSNTIWGKSGN